MKWILVILVLVLLSLKADSRPCDNPGTLYSYLDVERYNRSYPIIDYREIVNPIVDLMLQRGGGIREDIHELAMYWLKVCLAEGRPIEEVVAWKNLASEIHHRMHIDQSIFDLSKSLFGDAIGTWIMNPPGSFLQLGHFGDDVDSIFQEDQSRDCMLRLLGIYEKHCGPLGDYGFINNRYETFAAMCRLELDENRFDELALQICRDYIYVPSQ